MTCIFIYPLQIAPGMRLLIYIITHKYFVLLQIAVNLYYIKLPGKNQTVRKKLRCYLPEKRLVKHIYF